MPSGSMDLSRWWRYKDLRTLNLLLLIPLLSIFSQGFDGSMMNGLQAVSQWRLYFGAPKGAVLGLFNAAYPLGATFGVFFIPFVSDRWGRRVGLAVGAAISVLGGILQASSVNLAMFVIARLLLGIGCVITAGVGSPMITEIAHPHQRTTATALFLTFYSFGSIVAGWSTFGTFRIGNSAAWRIPSGLQAFPSLVQLIGIWWVPESPRWLVSKGRKEEAWRMVCKYHGNNDETDELALFEFEEINSAVNDSETLRNSFKAGLATLTALVKTPGNRKRTAILIWAALISQLSGNAFVSYYLSPILTSVGLTTDLQQTLINATSQMLSWFSALYFATLPAKVGRRTLFLASLICILICDISITVGSATFQQDNSNKAAAYTVVVFLYLFSPAYNLGLNGNLGLYIPEILPYESRTTGLAVFYFAQGCFSILSSFTTPIGLENLKWKFYVIFVIWVVVEFGVVYVLFPETKGPSLEDIAIIFDGDQHTLAEKDVEGASESKTGIEAHTTERIEKA
ncbi:general substrate transporter [Cadophora sp. DSE1049]|nr:general substrate transporter [Cadophora sp. DSE1049]